MFRKTLEKPLGQTAGVVSHRGSSEEEAEKLGISLEAYYLINPEEAGDDWRRYIGLRVSTFEKLIAFIGLETVGQRNARLERERLAKLKTQTVEKIFGITPSKTKLTPTREIIEIVGDDPYEVNQQMLEGGRG